MTADGVMSPAKIGNVPQLETAVLIHAPPAMTAAKLTVSQIFAVFDQKFFSLFDWRL